MTRSLCLALAISFTSGVAASGKESHHAKLSMEQARAIALREVSGKIVHEELEHEKGRWIYSIEVRPTGEAGNRVKEVNLDADSGKIVEVASETE